MKALLGRKLGMTEIFTDDGTTIPVTLVQAGPCTVVGVKTQDSDGYDAVQLGYEKAKNPAKAQQKQHKGVEDAPKHIKEFRGVYDLSAGDNLDVTVFENGDKVTVTGTSKGKGFSGTIKRHNFSRGPMTHGSHNYRRPGSIGGMYPQKVFKGKKMAGRMGSDTVSTKGLKVAAVQPEQNIIAVSGAVPGAKNGLVIIKGAE